MRTAYQLILVVAASLHFAVGGSSSTSIIDTDTNEIPTFNDDKEARSSDYANYFSAYDDLYHQKVMLTDHNRMKAYHDAIMKNKDLFKDKVVLDVGSGSGILAVWAAKAGAKRVYAIEYTNMANHAKNVVKANGVEDVVKVIQGAAEDVSLPLQEEDWDFFCGEDQSQKSEECKGDQKVVDIIVSEWMGYFLLRESMLDSVISIRDKFLKKSGLMFPSHASMLISPIATEKYRQEVEQDYSDAMTSWNEYLERAQLEYGVDMSVLNDKYLKEQKQYYLMSGHWLQLEAETVLSTPVVVKTLDMATCTLDDAKGVEEVPFDFSITMDDTDTNNIDKDARHVSGIGAWFTVDFKSRTDDIGKVHAPDVEIPVHLSTGPEVGVTHWGQQMFYLPTPIPLTDSSDIQISGKMEMIRSREYSRLYNVRFQLNQSTSGDPVELTYQIV